MRVHHPFAFSDCHILLLHNDDNYFIQMFYRAYVEGIQTQFSTLYKFIESIQSDDSLNYVLRYSTEASHAIKFTRIAGVTISLSNNMWSD